MDNHERSSAGRKRGQTVSRIFNGNLSSFIPRFLSNKAENSNTAKIERGVQAEDEDGTLEISQALVIYNKAASNGHERTLAEDGSSLVTKYDKSPGQIDIAGTPKFEKVPVESGVSTATKQLSGISLLAATEGGKEQLKQPFPGSGVRPTIPINIPGAADPKQRGDLSDALLRNYCSGHPPEPTYLPVSPAPAGPHLPRRSTLSDKPELDHLLRATLEMHDGKLHLPITAKAVSLLSPFWKGEKPIANYYIFRRVILTKDANSMPAIHVIAALKRIGGHAKELIVISPINTSGFTEVFVRAAGVHAQSESNEPNDWVEILSAFPNVELITFEVPPREEAFMTRDTYLKFSRAVSQVQFATAPILKFNPPTNMHENLNRDMVVYEKTQHHSSSAYGDEDEDAELTDVD